MSLEETEKEETQSRGEEGHMKTQAEMGVMRVATEKGLGQVLAQSLGKGQVCPHFDFGLVASGTVERYTSAIYNFFFSIHLTQR